MPADGSIIIDTRIDSKSAKADLQAIKAAAQATAKRITGLDKELTVATSKRSKLADDLKQAQAAADSTARSLDEVNARLDTARNKATANLRAEYPHLNAGEISRAAEGMLGKSSAADIKQADKLAAEYTRQAAAVDRLTQEYQQQTTVAERLEQQKQGLISQLNREQKAVENATQAYEKEQKKAGTSKKVPGLAQRTNQASKAMQRFGSRMREIVSGALLFNIISSGLSALVRWMGTALQSTDAFGQALRNLQGAASVAAAPLIDALGNALAYVINLLATGISYLARFISMLTGKSLSAMKSGAKAMNSYGAAAGSAAKQTEKAARSLAGFDEITRLDAPQEESSGGGGGGAAGPNYDFVDGTGAGFSSLLDTVKRFWARFAAALAPSVAAWGAAWDQIRSTAMAVWPQIQAAASGLWTNALQPLLTYLAGTWAPGILNAFSQAFAPIVGDLVSAGIRNIAAWFEWLCGILTDAINNLLIPGLDLILVVWQGLMSGIQSAWAQYGQPLVDGVLAGFESIRTMLSNLYYTVVEPIIAKAIELLQRLWTQHLQQLWNDVLAMLGAMGTAVLDLWNNVLAPLINWLISYYGPYFAAAFNATADVVGVVAGFIIDTIDAVIVGLRGVLDFLSAVFRGDWNTAWNLIGDTVDAVVDRMSNAVRNAANNAISYINGMIRAAVGGFNNLTGALNKLSFDLPEWLGGGHFGFNIGAITAPQIPYLAQGAVIPPNREFMAVLGDQSHGTNVEAPLSTIQQAVAAVMQDNLDGELAALEGIRGTLLDILQAVYGIDLSSNAVGRAVDRYQVRQAIITGRG